MKRNRPLFFTLFAVIVFCVTVSQNVFAQTESSRLYLKSGLEVMKQPVVEEDPVLLARDGLRVMDMAECQVGQTVHPGENCTYPGASRALSVSNDTTVVYDTGQNPLGGFYQGAAGNIMAQRYEVPSGARPISVSVAPVYDNQLVGSPVPDGAPRDFTLKIWNVDANGVPGDELYSMDVEEASNATHITQDFTYSFLQVDFPADEEALAALPNRIFIGLTDKGADRNYLVFATSRREDTAPDDAAFSYETIQSNTRWYRLANLLLSDGQSLRDQVFPIRPRFLTSAGRRIRGDHLVLRHRTKRGPEYLLFWKC